MAASRLALIAAACLAVAAPAVAQDAPRTSTAFTLETDNPRAPEQEAVRLDKLDVSLWVMPEQKAIRGATQLDFTVLSPVDRLSVELDTVYDVVEVSVDGVVVPRGRWRNPEGRLTAELPGTLAAGSKTTMRVVYSGSPRVAPRAPWNGGVVWATAPSGEPWIGSAMQLNGCDLLFACIDNSNAEPAHADIHITVPSNLAAPANGVFQGKTDNGDGTTTWNWSARNPNIYAINLNVGPYEEMTAEYHSRFGNVIPMHYWYLRTDKPEDVARLFAEFPLMLDFFESTIGPFPWGDQKMGVVETPYLGMEHQTINAYGNGYKLEPEGYDTLLQHEFSHEWFANQLTNWNADDMWLHEGLGSYMQPLYAGWLRGDRYMHRELADQRDGLLNRAPIVSRSPHTVNEVYNRPGGPGGDIYSKGSLVAHTLRMTIGDEDFYEALRILIYGRPDPKPGNFTPQTRSTPQFNEIVNQVTGRNYDWFFDAYLYEASLPVLTRTWEDGRMTFSWSTPAGVFPMPLEVRVNGRTQVLPMTGGRGSLQVPADAVVVVDPENKVLRQDPLIDRMRARR